MGIPSPKSKLRRVLDSTIPYDIGGAATALVPAGAAVAKFVNDNAMGWAWGVGMGSAATFALQIGKAVRTYRADQRKEEVVDLEGLLITMNSMLLADAKPEQNGFRSTLHTLDRTGTSLYQVVDYVGSQRRAKPNKGRTLPVNVGVIGKAWRERDAFAGTRLTDNYEDFVRLMVREYGFTTQQAKALDPATQSWMAAPLIGAQNDLYGVLYCDSTDRGFFTEARQQAIGHAVVGIAYFIGLRYS